MTVFMEDGMPTSKDWIQSALGDAAQTNYKKTNNDGTINRWIGDKWAYGKLSGHIHPAIENCIGLAMDAIRPTQGEDAARSLGGSICLKMTLEWPFQQADDAGRVSYFRSIEDGRNNKPSEMKLGAYIYQHFPDFTGDQIETIVRAYLDRNKMDFAIVTNQDLVEAMYATNAHSCMHPCQDQWPKREYHPYAAYTSRLGWAMAIRTDANGYGQSRCIIRPEDKTFIHIYGSEDGKHTTIGDDPSLRKWLIDAGYKVVNTWEGKFLERIPIPGKSHSGQPCYVGPYLDGNVKKAKLKKDDPSVMVITVDGNWDMANTNGYSYMTHPDREGMIRTYNGEWAKPEDTVAGINGEIYLRSEATMVDRRHNYVLTRDCFMVNGIMEYNGDCSCVSYINENGDIAEKYILNLNGDQIIRVKDGRYTRWAAKEDVALDYQDIYQFKARMIAMTGGSFKGKLALTTKTCTRVKDGLIVLTHLCRTSYTLSDKQWTPMVGDQVKLSVLGENFVRPDICSEAHAFIFGQTGTLTRDC